MTEDRKPETPGVSEASAKFVDEAEAATAAPPPSASEPDDPLITLGEQWKEAYGNWLNGRPADDAPQEEIIAGEERKLELGKIAWGIEDQAAKVPAQSVAGVLAQLRMAGTHYRLMECNDGEWTDKYAQLTWQTG